MENKIYQIENYFNMSIEEIYNSNLNLVEKTVNKYYKPYILKGWKEDLLANGKIGLYKGIETIDLTKGKEMVQIKSHLVWNIRTAINSFVVNMFGSNGSNKRKQSLAEVSINNDNKNSEHSYEESLSNTKNENESQRVEDKIDLYNAINKLPNDMKEVIALILKDYEQKEIAKILNLSEPKVCRLKNKAFAILRNELKEVI